VTDNAFPETDNAFPETDNAFPETDNAFPETDNAFPETEGLLFCKASFSYQGHCCVQHNHKLSAAAHGTDIIHVIVT